MFLSYSNSTCEVQSLSTHGHEGGSLNLVRYSPLNLVPAILVWWSLSDLKKNRVLLGRSSKPNSSFAFVSVFIWSYNFNFWLYGYSSLCWLDIYIDD